MNLLDRSISGLGSIQDLLEPFTACNVRSFAIAVAIGSAIRKSAYFEPRLTQANVRVLPPIFPCQYCARSMT